MSRVICEGSRVYIQDVRRMSWDTGDTCEFASALSRALECVGQDIPYHELAAACGAAFRFTLTPDHWNPGNYATDSVSADPLEPVRRAFDWAGRRFTFMDRGDAAQCRAAVTASVAQGIPVLGSGVVGPSDYSLITGFDEGGDVLMGWSFYQDIPDDHVEPPDASGYFRKTGWHGNTQWLIFPAGPTERKPLRRRCKDVLQWAVALARYPAADGCLRGLDAWDAFAADLEADEDFPPDDLETLGRRYLGLLCNLMMVDDRRAAGEFVGDLSEAVPDVAAHACAAAAAYTEIAAVREEIRLLVPEDFSEESNRKLGDRRTRQACADAFRRIRAADERAIRHIEACTSQM